MTGAELEAAFKRLLQIHESGKDNTGCIECVGCERCADSTFCRASQGLVRCHYCVDCAGCYACTHCRASRDLLHCNHCVASERCSHSSHLYRSVDCNGCSYCFGCVGLSKKDFHILNEPYDRSTYFALTAKLVRELRLG